MLTRAYAFCSAISPSTGSLNFSPWNALNGPFLNLPGYDVDLSPEGERFLTLYNS